MTNDDIERFNALLTGALGFYGQGVSEFAISVWWQACQRFEYEQVATALTEHAMDPDRGHFPPKPADIIRALQGTHTDRSLIAWGRVLESMQSVGAYSDIDFGDAAIHQAIEDAGGWVTMCRTTYDELPFVQRRFCDAYKAYSRRPDIQAQAPAMLQGAHSIANAAEGRGGFTPTRRLSTPDSMRAINVVPIARIGREEGVA